MPTRVFENKTAEKKKILQIGTFVINAVFLLLLQRSYRRREGNKMYTGILSAGLTERNPFDGLRLIVEEPFERNFVL